jgi:hypothetical protein
MKSRIFFKTLCSYSMVIFCLFSCSEDENNPSVQKIFFEHYAINNAWGLSYAHWIIDNEGNVRINHKNDSVIWLNYNDLNDNLRFFDSVVYTLDKSEIRQYINMIEEASAGKIDSIQVIRADFGTTVFNCFWYDKTKNRYDVILLSRMSDSDDKNNTDSSAVKIDTWLKNIHSKIYSEK